MTAWNRLVRFGFRLLYNELAFLYDAVAWTVSLGEWAAWRRAALDGLTLPDDARVLEIGYGTGDLHVEMHQRGWQLSGIDRSRAMGQITRRKLIRAGLPLTVMQADASMLPFADSCFDAVVCTFPSDYVVLDATLDELRRVLKAEGVVSIVLHGILTRRGPLVSLFDAAFRLTGQGGIRNPSVLDAETWQQVYQKIIAKFQQYGLTGSIRTVKTPHGLAIVLGACRTPIS